MSITREQINKINEKMGNGWELDLYYYLMHGEKTAVLKIDQEDGGYIQGKIYIDNVSSWRKDAYNGVQIKINVSRYYKGSTEGVFVSHGLGKWYAINRPDLKRCMFSEVQKMTHKITAAQIMGIYEQNSEQINNPVVLGVSA